MQENFRRFCVLNENGLTVFLMDVIIRTNYLVRYVRRCVMLKLVGKMRDLDFPALMNIYMEGNLEKAESYGDGGLLQAEEEFRDYLRADFFSVPGAFYALWEAEGKPVSALRMEPYQDGWLLEALETAPTHRNRGYAKMLISAVIRYLAAQGPVRVYSHVSRGNVPSLRTHYACGFEKFLDYAVYIDGSVTQRACTLRWQTEDEFA